MARKDLAQAKDAKKDEFYTQLTDIEKELRHYTEYFRDKVVFCNCDDPYESNCEQQTRYLSVCIGQKGAPPKYPCF